MPRDDDLLDAIYSAFRYAFSNMAGLLIGGIVVALSFLVIGLPFFLGYITRCMREVVKGNGVMPEWDEIGQMFVDGLRMSLVFLGYAVIYLLLIAIPAIPVLVFSYLNLTVLLVMSTLLLALTMGIAAALFGLVFFASWVLYASTGSVRKAINISKMIEFIMTNPSGFLVTVVASAVVVGAGLIAMALVVTIPWSVFTMSAGVTFIYARFYQSTMKLHPHMIEWLS